MTEDNIKSDMTNQILFSIFMNDMLEGISMAFHYAWINSILNAIILNPNTEELNNTGRAGVFYLALLDFIYLCNFIVKWKTQSNNNNNNNSIEISQIVSFIIIFFHFILSVYGYILVKKLLDLAGNIW